MDPTYDQNHKKPEAPSDFASYGIYNKKTIIKLAYKLPVLQNILRIELTAIYDTIKLSTTNTEPIYIFIDSLNSIYLINARLRHPTSQNNHPDKLLLQEITNHIKDKTSPLYIHNARAHKNILGNEEADKLAKKGAELKTISITKQHYNAH
jgi:ribonuclease HI